MQKLYVIVLFSVAISARIENIAQDVVLEP